MTEKHVIGPFKCHLPQNYKEAYLEIYGIDHFRPSYSVLVLLNDRDADPAKCSKDTPTYSGRFSVFGHAECAGDEGHCQVTPDRRRFDDRPSHALTKAFRRIPITRHLKKACEKSNELTVTLIASCDSGFDGFEGERLLQYDGLQIVAR